MKKNTSGFTIVELLIVIVVIAILAAITVVAYNGVQQRANNTARIANAQNAVKLVTAYIATYGTYPATTISCIGNGFAENNTKCWGIDSATPAIRHAAFNDTELSKIGSLPNNTTPPVQTPSYKALGPVYVYSAAYTVDGSPNPLIIAYFLDGQNQNCGLSNIVKEEGVGVWARVTSEPNNSGNSGNTTRCFVTMPKV